MIDSLLMVVELILSVFLEKKTRKTSQNSGIPSSQTDEDNTSTTKPSKPSRNRGGTGQSGNSSTEKTIRVDYVTTCDSCGIPLDDIPCSGHERRTKIDIVFEKIVEHVDAEIKQYPIVKLLSKGNFPRTCMGDGSMEMV